MPTDNNKARDRAVLLFGETEVTRLGLMGYVPETQGPGGNCPRCGELLAAYTSAGHPAPGGACDGCGVYWTTPTLKWVRG